MSINEPKCITKTNFQMLQELLENFHPENSGVSTSDEVDYINQVLCIPERDLLSLQNLRDFAVMFLAQRYESCPDENSETLDIMSAITGVIDMEKIRKGGTV